MYITALYNYYHTGQPQPKLRRLLKFSAKANSDSSGFPYFLQFKSEFGNKEFMI